MNGRCGQVRPGSRAGAPGTARRRRSRHGWSPTTRRPSQPSRAPSPSTCNRAGRPPPTPAAGRRERASRPGRSASRVECYPRTTGPSPCRTWRNNGPVPSTMPAPLIHAPMPLRVGSTQSLAAAGAGLVELQEAGDWQAPTIPAHYARDQLAARCSGSGGTWPPPAALRAILRRLTLGSQVRGHPSYCPTQKSCEPVSVLSAVLLSAPPFDPSGKPPPSARQQRCRCSSSRAAPPAGWRPTVSSSSTGAGHGTRASRKHLQQSSSTAPPASHGRRWPTSSAPPAAGTSAVPADRRARAPTKSTRHGNATTKRQRRAPPHRTGIAGPVFVAIRARRGPGGRILTSGLPGAPGRFYHHQAPAGPQAARRLPK